MLNGESGARSISSAFPAASLDESLGAELFLTGNAEQNSVDVDCGRGVEVILQYKNLQRDALARHSTPQEI